MKGATFRYGALLVAVFGFAGTVMANEAESDPRNVTDKDRVSRNFTREAATVGEGTIRLEVRGLYLKDDGDKEFDGVNTDRLPELDFTGFPLKKFEECLDDKVESIDGGIIGLLGSYGLGPNAELGFDIPFFIQSTKFVGRTSDNEADIGDVVLYGKLKRKVAKNSSLGGGLELNLPTGVEHKLFGRRELGFNPFLAYRYTRGRFAVGLHTGYYMYGGDVPDVFNWSFQAIVRGSEEYTIRTEVSGRLFKQYGTEYNDVVVMPGLDFWVSDNLIIRPTGLAHLTDEAVDWGLGIGVAVIL